MGWSYCFEPEHAQRHPLLAQPAEVLGDHRRLDLDDVRPPQDRSDALLHGGCQIFVILFIVLLCQIITKGVGFWIKVGGVVFFDKVVGVDGLKIMVFEYDEK